MSHEMARLSVGDRPRGLDQPPSLGRRDGRRGRGPDPDVQPERADRPSLRGEHGGAGEAPPRLPDAADRGRDRAAGTSWSRVPSSADAASRVSSAAVPRLLLPSRRRCRPSLRSSAGRSSAAISPAISSRPTWKVASRSGGWPEGSRSPRAVERFTSSRPARGPSFRPAEATSPWTPSRGTSWRRPPRETSEPETSPATPVSRRRGATSSSSPCGGAVIARTTAGDITLRKTRGPVVAQTSGGSVLCEIVSAVRPGVEVTTGGGDVTLVLPANYRGDVDVRVTGVDSDEDYIVSQFPEVAVVKRETLQRAEGKLGGGGPKIAVRTTAGVVRIRKGPPSP